MQNQMAKLIEEVRTQAVVCETIAKDMTEESLTGESRKKADYAAAAQEWTLKAGVWREAEHMACTLADPSQEITPLPSNPLESRRNVMAP